MAITLGAIQLPAGLFWSDEFAWTPVSLSTEYSLTGALLVQAATKQAGRPITLTGQSDGLNHTAWISRTNLMALKTALNVTGASWTLTLHDTRTFTVMAAPDEPLDAEPLPVVRSFAPADPSGDRWYVLRALKLIAV